jgi:hypothetical protein
MLNHIIPGARSAFNSISRLNVRGCNGIQKFHHSLDTIQMLNCIYGGNLSIIKAPRQSGKTTTALACIYTEMCEKPGTNILVNLPKLVYREHCVEIIKNFDNNEFQAENHRELIHKNGSLIRFNTSANSSPLRGCTFDISLWDELAFHQITEKKRIFDTFACVAQCKTRTIVISTHRPGSLFDTLFKMAEHKKWIMKNASYLDLGGKLPDYGEWYN